MSFDSYLICNKYFKELKIISALERPFYTSNDKHYVLLYNNSKYVSHKVYALNFLLFYVRQSQFVVSLGQTVSHTHLSRTQA